MFAAIPPTGIINIFRQNFALLLYSKLNSILINNWTKSTLDRKQAYTWHKNIFLLYKSIQIWWRCELSLDVITIITKDISVRVLGLRRIVISSLTYLLTYYLLTYHQRVCKVEPEKEAEAEWIVSGLFFVSVVVLSKTNPCYSLAWAWSRPEQWGCTSVSINAIVFLSPLSLPVSLGGWVDFSLGRTHAHPWLGVRKSVKPRHADHPAPARLFGPIWVRVAQPA